MYLPLEPFISLSVLSSTKPVELNAIIGAATAASAPEELALNFLS